MAPREGTHKYLPPRAVLLAAWLSSEAGQISQRTVILHTHQILITKNTFGTTNP